MAGREKFTDEELEMLTEEEREGLLDDELLDPEEALDEPGGSIENPDKQSDAKKPDESEDDDDTGDDDGAKKPDEGKKDDDEPPAKKPEDAEAAAAAAAEAEAAKKKQDEPEPEKPATPQQQALPRYEVPPDAKDKLKGFDDQLDELAQKADDGEITFAEMRQQQREIERQRDELREQVLKQSLTQDFGKANWFNRDVPSFLGEHPEYAAGSMRHSLLDTTVRRLQAEADNPFDPGLLEKAHALIVKELGSAPGAKPAPTPDPKNKREIPPTLAHAPAADISEAADGGKYAHLDRLADADPMAYEDALARMSDAEREAYLASA